MPENVTYVEAFNELQAIVAQMEEGNISVDELSEKVKRATALIAVCRRKLTTTEEEVGNILEELDRKEA